MKNLISKAAVGAITYISMGFCLWIGFEYAKYLATLIGIR